MQTKLSTEKLEKTVGYTFKNKKLLKYHIRSTIKYFNKWGWIFDRKRADANKKCLNQIKLLNK